MLYSYLIDLAREYIRAREAKDRAKMEELANYIQYEVASAIAEPGYGADIAEVVDGLDDKDFGTWMDLANYIYQYEMSAFMDGLYDESQKDSVARTLYNIIEKRQSDIEADAHRALLEANLERLQSYLEEDYFAGTPPQIPKEIVREGEDADRAVVFVDSRWAEDVWNTGVDSTGVWTVVDRFEEGQGRDYIYGFRIHSPELGDYIVSKEWQYTTDDWWWVATPVSELEDEDTEDF